MNCEHINNGLIVGLSFQGGIRWFEYCPKCDRFTGERCSPFVVLKEDDTVATEADMKPFSPCAFIRSKTEVF